MITNDMLAEQAGSPRNGSSRRPESSPGGRRSRTRRRPISRCTRPEPRSRTRA
ncbi:hypothetical protein NKH77_39450 [Streptomyces sp. M19]